MELEVILSKAASPFPQCCMSCCIYCKVFQQALHLMGHHDAWIIGFIVS